MKGLDVMYFENVDQEWEKLYEKCLKMDLNVENDLQMRLSEDSFFLNFFGNLVE